MNKRKHLEILDEYAAEALADVKKALRKQYDIVKKLRRELEEASMDENDRMREQSLLEFEVQEIEEANLKVGEDEELEERFRKMTNSRRIVEALGIVQQLCMDGEPSATELIGRSCRELSGC